ncbi:hypothetical protein DAI22_11g071600 [Oryza sativa Japonica Group]|nr:hypothetical protein DAI22_11g071600 [Oryza sativa Japonica Group]
MRGRGKKFTSGIDNQPYATGVARCSAPAISAAVGSRSSSSSRGGGQRLGLAWDRIRGELRDQFWVAATAGWLLGGGGGRRSGARQPALGRAAALSALPESGGAGVWTEGWAFRVGISSL